MVQASEREGETRPGAHVAGRKKGNESEANGHAIVREKIYRYTMRARTAQGIDSSVSDEFEYALNDANKVDE